MSPSPRQWFLRLSSCWCIPMERRVHSYSQQDIASGEIIRESVAVTLELRKEVAHLRSGNITPSPCSFVVWGSGTHLPTLWRTPYHFPYPSPILILWWATYGVLCDILEYDSRSVFSGPVLFNEVELGKPIRRTLLYYFKVLNLPDFFLWTKKKKISCARLILSLLFKTVSDTLLFSLT